MTKKHFKKLAEELAYVRPDFGSPEYATWKRSVEAVATACRSANPRFNYDTFYAACGATEGAHR